jgi:hypothetical protein
MNKTILLHYHLFKNAGSSIDRLLIENFDCRWAVREFGSRANPALMHREITEWIVGHENVLAFSSHTIELPMPDIDGIKIIPIIFVRHPIDRIVSAYNFERIQGGSGWPSVLARNTSLKGYIEVRLAMPGDRQCREFHLDRFSRHLPATEGSELERALHAVQELPFVGVVEEFDRSIEKLAQIIHIDFPDFIVRNVKENVSRDAALNSLDKKMNSLREEIGSDLLSRLLESNAGDMRLYEFAIKKLNH